jgi:hypothetical protein
MWYAELPAALFSVGSWYSDWAVEFTIQNFIPGRYKRIFPSPKQPDSFSNSPHLLYDGYWGLLAGH